MVGVWPERLLAMLRISTSEANPSSWRETTPLVYPITSQRFSQISDLVRILMAILFPESLENVLHSWLRIAAHRTNIQNPRVMRYLSTPNPQGSLSTLRGAADKALNIGGFLLTDSLHGCWISFLCFLCRTGKRKSRSRSMSCRKQFAPSLRVCGKFLLSLLPQPTSVEGWLPSSEDPLLIWRKAAWTMGKKHWKEL